MTESAPTASAPAVAPAVLRIFLAAHEADPEPIAITKADATILYANRAGAAALGSTPEGVIGRSAWDLEPGLTPERWAHNLVKLRADGHLLVRRATPPEVAPRRTLEMRASLVAVDGQEFIFTTLRDVTAQADAEAALVAKQARELEDARLRSLERIVNDIELVVRPTGEIVMANDRAATAHGYAREALCAMNVRELLPPERAHGVAARLSSTTRRGAALFESVNRRRDGSHFPTEVSLRHFRVGEQDYLHAIVRDISARKVLELELERAQREQQTILANATVGITLVRERKMVWANERMAELTGYSVAEMRGMSTALLYADQAAYEAIGEEAYAVLDQGGSFATERQLRRRDGSAYWAHIQGRLVDFEDASAGSTWVFEDVTERMEMEVRLRASEERYATLFQVLPVGVSITDAAGRLVDNNPASERLLGLARAGHLERTIDAAAWNILRPDLSPMPPEEFAAVRALREQRVVEGLEMGVVRPDGATSWLEVTAAPIPVEGLGVAIVYSDVTERRTAAAERERLNAELEARVREEVASNRRKDQLLITQSRQAAMGEMIGNIAHQWRQPLNALGLVLSNLRDAAEEGPLALETLRNAVDDGQRLVRRMSTTINDFRDFFLPEKAPSAFSALRQVTETVALMRASFQQRNITIEVSEAEDPLVFGFPNEYSQVVLNLLTNAKDAIVASEAPAGRVDLRLSVEHDFGVLSVRDDGGGIREEVLDRVFDPYFSTKKTGTGIGLYMSKTIVERSMKGRIEARNVVGGAELRVLVPLARVDR